MLPSNLPLNALRAFEAAARNLSFVRAADELCVTPAAISHQVKKLEAILRVPLFRRLPRGLALTDEAQALVPVLAESFERIGRTLERFRDGRVREVLTLGVVGTFAIGWLLPRLSGFTAAHPFVDLRILTNNNRVDLAGEGLDGAIRFGDGAWHGTEALPLFEAPLTPLCAPAVAERLLAPTPGGLGREVLLRSYRADEWTRWFAAAGAACPPLRGPVFDSSLALAEAAAQGHGVALLPARLFRHAAWETRLQQPFATEVSTGRYWLTRLHSRPLSEAMRVFRDWILDCCAADGDAVAAASP
ncbi:LysR substrate-binding domain-containing protein [Roseomonas elaeocarpi]|uniref:LysR substrate-binding domain-containing protein n=1 Tax=Roseomonas elaeocarpi TaxID=907779 RepID=A0ABV6JWK1_9PROT